MSTEHPSAFFPHVAQPEPQQVVLPDPHGLQQGRDQLLEATANAANILLTLENFNNAINAALKIIAEASGCDRIKVLENGFDAPSSLPTYSTVIYEWARPDFLRQMACPESRRTSNTGMEAFMERHYLYGDGFGGLLEDWDEPLRSAMATFQVQSAYSVPIWVNGQWWGILALNYCRAAIQISSAEVALLRTIANCIGSAIQRDRMQQERDQVSQQRVADLEAYNHMLQRRDRLLEATAAATNGLLTLESFDDAINSALKIITEGSGCDRIGVLENNFDDSAMLPTHYTIIYEFARPGIISQIPYLEGRRISNEGRAAFMERNYIQGEGFGGLLEEWDEPVRSTLASIQVKSCYAVPIRVNGQWWGLLSVDHCREAIRISPAEMAVLRTIADCIGSAIQRDRTRTLILKAEQERVAELVRANAALKQSLDTLVADPDLDRFIGHTLKLIAHEFDAPLIEYRVHSDSENTAYIHLTYWQGKILRLPEQHNSPELTPFLDILLSVGYSNIGALAIYLPSYRSFSRQTIELAHALAQQLTLAIELTRLAEESRQSALLQERTRMAREIHDTLAQAFGGILMQLQAATYFAASQPDKAQSHLLTAQTLAKDGLTEARRSVWTLYLETTEYEDPAQTIAKFIQQTTSRQSVPIQLAIEGTPYRLHPDLGLNLLRIAQEAITNALRHAQAQAIQIHLSYSPQALQLTIRDDGCGFDPQLPARGFGLAGMQQRAAHLGANWHLISQLGQGTTITVTLMG